MSESHRKVMRDSRNQENRGASLFGGKRVGGSGNSWSHKGDTVTPDLLIEYKFTGKKTYSLKAEELEKNVNEAVARGREPVFGVLLNGKNYVIIPEGDFIDLREQAHDRTGLGS